MDAAGLFNHGPDPEQTNLSLHRHSLSFDDHAADAFLFDDAGTSQAQALAQAQAQAQAAQAQAQAQAQAHAHHQAQAQAQARSRALSQTLARDMLSDELPEFRRDSTNNVAFSPVADLKWEDHRRHSFASTNPFRHDMTTPASARPSLSIAPSSTLSPAMPQSASGWHFDHPSSTASPLSFDPPYSTSGDDFELSEFSHAAGGSLSTSPDARRISAPTPFSDVQQEALLDTQTIKSPHSQTPGSDWMAMAANDAQAKGLPRHMRAGYRPPRPTPTRAASDGVRKKNARIDIPADRTLGNIDELIDKAHDEDEVKELKAQRRLLRNREAALASRQRKKIHTEELEFKEQRYAKQIADLQAECGELAHHRHRLEVDFNVVHQKYTEACHAINAYELEKEELVMKHTQETGKLRREIQCLSEQLENLSMRDHMSTQENITAFTSDMNALSVDPHSYAMHAAQDPAATNMHTAFGHFPSAPPANPVDSVKPAKREAEQPIASGVLFMILLCGAFVASKANSRPIIPRLPDEVRVASSTVLDNLLKDPAADAFVGNSGLQHMMAHPVAGAHVPQSSPWERDVHSDGRQPLYRSLATPTGQPTHEQLFALSPAEYQSLTSPENYLGHIPQSTSTPKRNLAETLASLREESISKATPAEVYSRSLLWDQIPLDVVRQFKELVKESRTMDETAAQGFPMGQHMKHEYAENPMWNYHMEPTGYDDHHA
ncbi:hypothetical protein ANO11243_089480 [Dothideomycetidae sp. 11243]|nr:hypothetical protein ANO11243_089480 [fungal sp. No.11243]